MKILKDKKIREAFRQVGSLGGKATLKKYGKEHFRMLNKKSHASKRRKLREVSVLDKPS